MDTLDHTIQMIERYRDLNVVLLEKTETLRFRLAHAKRPDIAQVDQIKNASVELGALHEKIRQSISGLTEHAVSMDEESSIGEMEEAYRQTRQALLVRIEKDLEDGIRRISRLRSEDEELQVAVSSLISDLHRSLEAMRDGGDAALAGAIESADLCKLISRIVDSDDERQKLGLLDRIYGLVRPLLYRGLMMGRLCWTCENGGDAVDKPAESVSEPPAEAEAPEPISSPADEISADVPTPGDPPPEAPGNGACGDDAALPDGETEENAQELEEFAEADSSGETAENGMPGSECSDSAGQTLASEVSHQNPGGSDQSATPFESASETERHVWAMPPQPAESRPTEGNLKQLLSCPLTSPALLQKALRDIGIDSSHPFRPEKSEGPSGQGMPLSSRKPEAADSTPEGAAAQMPKAQRSAPESDAAHQPEAVLTPAPAVQAQQETPNPHPVEKPEPSAAPEPAAASFKDESDALNLTARAYADFLARRESRPDLAETLTLLRKLLRDPGDEGVPERDDLLDALVFVKTLTLDSGDEKIERLYQQLLLATDIPLDRVSYDGTIKTIAFEDGGMLPGLEIAAMLRATLAPSTRDFTLYAAAEAMVKSDDCFPNWAHVSKQLLNALLEVKSFPGGFSDATLSNLNRHSFGQRYAGELSANARKYLDNLPVIKQKITGLPEMLSLCFGPGSDLGEALDIVARNDQGGGATGVVRCALELYGSGDAPDEYVDRNWKTATQGQKTMHMKLGMLARKVVLDEIHKRLELLEKWLEMAENRIDAPEVLARLRGQLIKQIGAAEAEARSVRNAQTDEDAIASRVLAHMLHAMDLRLSMKQAEENRFRFLSLLGTEQIALDEVGFPDFDKEFGTVMGYEPWRRALRHIAGPVLPLEEVLEATGNPASRYIFDNLFSARLICGYLKMRDGREIGKDFDANRKHAEDAANAEKSRLLEDLEMAFAYGRVSEELQQRLMGYVDLASDTADSARRTLFSRSDFGRWRFFLDALKEQIEKETDIKGSKHEARYRSVTENLSEGMDNELIVAVRRNLDEKNFIVAEEYLNRYEAGERSLPESDLAQDEHARFVALYPRLSSLCENNKGNALKNWGYLKLEPLLDKNWASGQKKDARYLIESWPNQGMSGTDYITRLFGALGFEVKTVKKQSVPAGKKFERYALEARPVQKGLADYSHPIAVFGTQLRSPLEVACIFGARTAQELINIMIELHLGENSIVLFDSALEHTERRQLAERFRSRTSGLNSFLLIDRVLMLFLATLETRERLPGLLKCTLPYTYYQPFNNGRSSIADEMFMGRKTELASIMAPAGPSLVYGGKQLGKTALLERTKSMLHKPERREYAVEFSIYGYDESQALSKTVEELGKEGLVTDSPKSWEALSSELDDKFRAGKISRLVLLMDEADDFLENASRSDYRVLFPLLELKRKTRNSFKFVLAGLHNVARAKRAMERNGLLTQLGEPLCIRPLSPLDARRLMERPLSYLGFKPSPQSLTELILASVNYYPGILHFFGYTLIQSISERYTEYYSAAKGNPPFELQEKQLRTILASENLNRSIKEKLEQTLALDPRYRMIANQIAWNYYQNDKTLGCETRELYRQAQEYDITMLRNLDFEDYALLFDEMVDMGILSKTVLGQQYRLRRNDFLRIIGSLEAVQEAIQAAMGAAV